MERSYNSNSGSSIVPGLNLMSNVKAHLNNNLMFVNNGLILNHQKNTKVLLHLPQPADCCPSAEQVYVTHQGQSLY